MQPNAQQLLASAGTPALLISNLVNIRYLTGLNLSSGLVLVHGKKIILFTDSRYTEMAKEEVNTGISVKNSASIEAALAHITRCGFEAHDVTVARLRTWKKKFKQVTFFPTDNIVEEFRRAKNPEELRALKQAENITKKIMERIPSALQPGITERALAWNIYVWAMEFGAEKLSFESIVAFGTHTSRPHHQATNRKLKKGDIVQIDCGAVYNGYCGDLSRIFFTGTISVQQQHVYDAVSEAKSESTKLVKAGVLAADVDACARKILKKHKLEKYFTHSLGHGVGLDIHEGATLSSRSKQTLLKNEVVTIEPGVYIPGKFGIRLEDMVVVR